jgi:predicted RNA binding protein YcfA (HicA-like mRNA interferase family)
MPRITPIHWKVLECILFRCGFHFVRQDGSSHRIYTKKGLIRPLVVPAHNKDLAVRVIKSNLRTAEISNEQYFELLKDC